MGSHFGTLDPLASPGELPRADLNRPALLSVMLSAAGAAAALAVAVSLWLAPVPLDMVRSGSQLCLQTAELTLAIALGSTDGEPAITHAAAGLDANFAKLQALSAPHPAVASALSAATAHWAAVRAALPDADRRDEVLAGLRAQARLAENLAMATEAAHASNRRQRDSMLAFAALAAASVILWAALAMRRHRHHLRRMMRQFSSDLGNGDWQDAVRSLRRERVGAPSAWDALASGVESVLGESDRRWQALADLAADWYFETDTRHRLAWMSGAAPPVSTQGWTLAEVIGCRHDGIGFFEAPAEGWERFHARLDARKAFRELEFRVFAKGGGAPIWVSISGRPRQDISGRFAGYEGVGRDVTERRQAHERLRTNEQRWSLMAGLASDYYWETDAEHRLLPMRPEMLRRFGAMSERIEGRTRWDAHPQAMTPAQWAEHRADLAAHRPFRSLQLEVEFGEGRFLWLSISGIPRFDRDGGFVGYHGVGRDVTMRKQAERLLLRHNDELQLAVAERTRELEQVNLDLDAFARQLAHELRTPIGHVQGLAHLLETRAGALLAPDDRHLLTLQVQAARQMRDTVDALLLLARSTMQPMPMETVDLSALARGVITELPALQRSAPVVWEIQEDILVKGSAAALRIVLTNVLGNAAKFTRRTAQPVVQIRATPGADSRVRVTVQDNGAGFEMAQVERLFKPFNRLHAGEDYQGTGIGLTIVQRIVERHGGRVTAEGAPGQGARFDLSLPAAPAPART